jgi:antitoxin (DNA-binding transcriptional repressor) of toxin-antitoxin stability system
LLQQQGDDHGQKLDSHGGEEYPRCNPPVETSRLLGTLLKDLIPNYRRILRMRLHKADRDLTAALKAVKTGDSVVLTDGGEPFAVVEPLREATKEEEEVIRELIESGALQPGRKSGKVREWKWKSTRRKAA